MVGAGRVDAMLIRDDLPELSADLVAALAALDGDNLTHDRREERAGGKPGADRMGREAVRARRGRG
eukprot:scaffold304081_cov28-Tisochrysis_lutea.AAC.1